MQILPAYTIRLVPGNTIGLSEKGFQGPATGPVDAYSPGTHSLGLLSLPTAATAARAIPRFKAPFDTDSSLPVRQPLSLAKSLDVKLSQEHRIQFSPTDVVNYFHDPLITWLERHHIEMRTRQVTTAEPCPSEFLTLLRQKGRTHEETVLQKMQSEKQVVMVSRDQDFTLERQKTLIAMEMGAEVIYQPALSRASDPFVGHVDFLFKVKNSAGVKTRINGRDCDWHYVPCEVKLSKRAKPEHLLQLSLYAHMLEDMQDYLPPSLYVINGKGETEAYRTQDYFDLSMHYREAFLTQQELFDANVVPLPHRLPLGDWHSYVDEYLTKCDDLRSLPGMMETQAVHLNNAGIRTITELSASPLKTVPQMPEPVFAKYQLLARLIVQAKTSGTIQFQLTDDLSDQKRGLQTLPPSAGKKNDLFLILQASPLVQGDLCFNMGVTSYGTDTKDGVAQRGQLYQSWANDETDEERNFSNLMDNIRRRLSHDRHMHVYVYGSSTTERLRKLAQKHGKHEALLDSFFERGVFVDLEKIFKDSFLTSSVNTELVALAPLLGANGLSSEYRVDDAVMLAGHYFETEDAEIKQNALNRLGIKTKADTALLFRMYQFLSSAQTQQKAKYQPRTRPLGPRPPFAKTFDGAHTTVDLKDTTLLIQRLWGRFGSSIAAHQRGERTPDAERGRVALLLTQLLQYHIREKRAWFGQIQGRIEKTPFELVADTVALGDMQLLPSAPTEVKHGKVFRFTFPAQETKVKQGLSCLVSQNLRVGVKIEHIDFKQGEVSLRISDNMLTRLGGTMPETLALLPYDYVSPQAMHDAIYRIAQRLDQKEPRLPSLTGALLFRMPPHITEWDEQHGTVGEKRAGSLIKGNVYDPDETGIIEGVNAISHMRGSVLCVQGIPASGKTTLAARAILEQIKAGKRTAISGLTHRGMNNLAVRVAELAKEEGLQLNLVKVDDGQEQRDERLSALAGDKIKIQFYRTGETLAKHVTEYDVVVASPWVMSRPEFSHQFSHLFIDEAGQLSLANALAMTHCAANLILLGDQRQNRQPLQARHPGLSGLSVLDYMLSGLGTDVPVVPDDFGLFLGQSFRMAPPIAEFASQEFYDGRLQTAEVATRRQLIAPERPVPVEVQGKRFMFPPAGIVALPITGPIHSRQNPEEALAVQAILESLKHFHVEQRNGAGDVVESAPLDSARVFVMAPFTAQVNALARELPPDVLVSTVDGLQGRENSVVLYSLGVSDPDSQHGVTFAMDPRRINTALTRAQVLFILLANPHLLDRRPGTIAEMKNLNRLAMLLRRYAPEPASGPDRDSAR